MSQNTPQTPALAPEAAPHKRAVLRNKNLIKLAVISGLALLLLVPLALLGPVVHERMERRDGAVAEIQSSWGTAQRVFGPILVVPIVESDGKPGQVYVLPEELAVDGQLAPETRARGIYQGVVYTAAVKLSGSFRRPTAAELGLSDVQLDWDRAFVSLAVTDLRGVGDTITMTWGEGRQTLLPGTRVESWATGLHAPVAAPPVGGAPVKFALDLSLRGSDRLRVAPLGVRNEVTLRSSWPNPSFTGTFLPVTRDVGDGGFRAVWRMSHYARQLPQMGLGPIPAAAVENASFGVDLLLGIDGYRGVERATKYGALFIGLVFLCFFLTEVTGDARIHPFQYGMVGLALGVFFLLLLALSEVLPFVVAYAGAGAATTICISLYSWSTLRRRALRVTALLGACFALLYVVLRAEDYALLAGSLALFAALAATMRLTRRIDWFARDDEEEAATAPAPRPQPAPPPPAG